MSVGKIRPRYFHSKSFARPGFDSDSEKEFDTEKEEFDTKKESETKPLSGKNSSFNGFSTADDYDEQDQEKPCNDDALLKEHIHIETHPNGGASLVRMYDKDFSMLTSENKDRLAQLFFEEVFSEEPENVAKHVIGIVHGAARYMPELVSHLSLTRPDLDIKVSGRIVIIAGCLGSLQQTSHFG